MAISAVYREALGNSSGVDWKLSLGWVQEGRMIYYETFVVEKGSRSTPKKSHTIVGPITYHGPGSGLLERANKARAYLS